MLGDIDSPLLRHIAKLREGKDEGLPPPTSAKLKETEFVKNRRHAFLCSLLYCMLVSMQNNLKNHKNKNNLYVTYKKGNDFLNLIFRQFYQKDNITSKRLMQF